MLEAVSDDFRNSRRFILGSRNGHGPCYMGAIRPVLVQPHSASPTWNTRVKGLHQPLLVLAIPAIICLGSEREEARIEVNATQVPGPISHLLSACQNRLEMRRLLFAGDNVDFHSLEPGFLKPLLQVALRKAQPSIAI